MKGWPVHERGGGGYGRAQTVPSSSGLNEGLFLSQGQPLSWAVVVSGELLKSILRPSEGQQPLPEPVEYFLSLRISSAYPLPLPCRVLKSLRCPWLGVGGQPEGGLTVHVHPTRSHSG